MADIHVNTDVLRQESNALYQSQTSIEEIIAQLNNNSNAFDHGKYQDRSRPACKVLQHRFKEVQPNSRME